MTRLARNSKIPKVPSFPGGSEREGTSTATQQRFQHSLFIIQFKSGYGTLAFAISQEGESTYY